MKLWLLVRAGICIFIRANSGSESVSFQSVGRDRPTSIQSCGNADLHFLIRAI